MNIKWKNKSRGISLIETIVSIMILTMALTAGVQLMISIVTQTAKNKTRIQAIYLTQECLELARNARDTAWRKFQPWDCALQNGTYKIWAAESIIPECGDNTFGVSLAEVSEGIEGDFTLNKVNDAQNLYSHETGTPTQFLRKIIIENFPEESDDETALGKKITCRTYWIRNDKEQEVKISEVLTDWKK